MLYDGQCGPSSPHSAECRVKSEVKRWGGAQGPGAGAWPGGHMQLGSERVTGLEQLPLSPSLFLTCEQENRQCWWHEASWAGPGSGMQ